MIMVLDLSACIGCNYVRNRQLKRSSSFNFLTCYLELLFEFTEKQWTHHYFYAVFQIGLDHF